MRAVPPLGEGRGDPIENCVISECPKEVKVARAGLVHAAPVGREKRYRVDEAQLARAVAQLASVGATWDARLRRIKRIAEAIHGAQRSQQQANDKEGNDDG